MTRVPPVYHTEDKPIKWAKSVEQDEFRDWLLDLNDVARAQLLADWLRSFALVTDYRSGWMLILAAALVADHAEVLQVQAREQAA
jgi:hypothetical protein